MLHIVGMTTREGFQNVKVREDLSYELSYGQTKGIESPRTTPPEGLEGHNLLDTCCI